MTTATLERVTIAEFLARDDQDDYELIDGELKERCMSAKAVWVTTELGWFVAAFNRVARERPEGHIRAVPKVHASAG